MRCDVAIVGAGPAGMAAADTLAKEGLAVALIDEQWRPGGQVLRQPPAGYQVANWLPQAVYREGKALLRRVEQQPAIHWLPGSTVLGVLPSGAAQTDARFRLLVDGDDGPRSVFANQVLLATGCHDMALPFPGWTLPGVMMAGGVQAFVKSQQLIPGERFLFVGSHPLQLVVADQLLEAGGEVAEVVFPQHFKSALALLREPLVLGRFAGKFLFLARALMRLLRAGVPIRFGEGLLAACGEGQLQSVTLAPLDGRGQLQADRAREVRVDRLATCFGFTVSSELARQAGADCQWSGDAGGWIIAHDEWMQTRVDGLYAAGEITAVAGADAALVEGRLAALGMLYSRGLLGEREGEQRACTLRRQLSYHNRFAGLLRRLASPGDLPQQLLSDEVTLCKCENIRCGEVSAALAANPALCSANAAKLLTRVGMGLCQGRYCNTSLTREIARQRGIAEAEVGPFSARFPAKPVPIARLLKSSNG